MKHFFIVTRDDKEEKLALIHEIMDYIQLKGGVCGYGVNPEDDSEEELQVPKDTDVILTIGGDGTLIRAAQNIFGKNIPMIGVNRGHLGYLCDLDEASVYDGIDSMMQGDYSVEERMMLSGYVMRSDGSVSRESQALNDIVVSSAAGLQVMHVRVYVNGQYLYAYNCDGMIFSTPTGSTAYNLSAHGPIVNPKTNLILLTPINPHTLNARSIVLDPYDELVLEICSRRDEESEEAEISFDGNHKRLLRPGEKLVVHRAEETTKMIHLSDISFLDRIRTKMQAN
jgi:NAD+ kinase